MKIVIDTNVLISAAFFGGVPKKVIDLVTTKNVAAYINEDILTEYNVTVSKMITKKKARINQNLFEQFIKNGALETPSFSYGEENAPFTSFLYIF